MCLLQTVFFFFLPFYQLGHVFPSPSKFSQPSCFDCSTWFCELPPSCCHLSPNELPNLLPPVSSLEPPRSLLDGPRPLFWSVQHIRHSVHALPFPPCALQLAFALPLLSCTRTPPLSSQYSGIKVRLSEALGPKFKKVPQTPLTKVKKNQWIFLHQL